MRAMTGVPLLAMGLVACGGSDTDGSGGSGASMSVGPSSGSAPSGTASGNPTSSGSGGAPTSCDDFGHFGPPGTTFTLPATDGTSIYYDDVKAAFPDVDFTTLSRLYIPAGHYKSVSLGNLPDRDAASPLVITNKGGQVAVGPNDPDGNFIWAMNGGSNWILTGRYDPDSGTGDEAFQGHRCGAYAGSRGHYGFLSDDAFAHRQYLHMGIAVGGVTDVELEYLEITRSGFAGIRMLNPGDTPLPMANVRIHDNYVHDTDGEGFYIGWTGAPPSNPLPGLQVYQNRIVRTGNEALQIQNLGDGTEVHNNVVAFASLHWRDNGLGNYQDNNSQIQTRSGNIAIHDNVFIGGSGSILSFFSSPEAGDAGRHVTFTDNFFADTKWLGGYLNGMAGSDSDFHFEHNAFRGLDFTYDLLDPSATDPGVIFGVNQGLGSPITFTNNSWEGSRKIVSGIAGGDGTSGSITASGNVNGPVEDIAFVASGYPDGASVQKLEAWAPKATLSPGQPDIVYQPGDLVMFDAQMYRCSAESSNQKPPEHPEAWEALPLPTDDLRVVESSPWAAYGVH